VLLLWDNIALFWHGDTRSYLIDGVAINGVSGGPVIYHTPAPETIHVIGVISAYIANRQQGQALPGLSVAQDISHSQSVMETIKSIDQAQQAKKELEEKAAKSAVDGPAKMVECR